MKNNTTFIFIVFSIFIYSCNNSSKENPNPKNEIFKPNQQELAEGFRLTEISCFSCHSPDASLKSKIAPSMESIKKLYINGNVSYEQFTQELIAFLNNPSEEKSKMPGAIEQFNLMPKVNLSDEQFSKIAAYIYFSDIEKPDWFKKQYQEEKEKYEHNYISNLSPIEIGQNIAMETKGVLGKNLLEAINSKGTVDAISFCSTRAIPLTDSMAISLNATIKRVSDKTRNPKNKANKAELSYIEATKLAIANGKTPLPKLTVLENKQIGYYPILTNKMCMQCHGQLNTEILPGTLSIINKLYPNDLATGYRIDEIRGIWVIEMGK